MFKIPFESTTCQVRLLDMPRRREVRTRENFHGTEKEQALLKQERFRVDFKRDSLVDTQY